MGWLLKMAMKAKVLGREALTRRLNELAPNVEKYAAAAKLEIAQDAAKQIAARAPRDTGDYAESIEGGLLSSRPRQQQIGIQATKDKDATGVFGKFTWRWLEFGTAPHAIGSGVHPGTAAQPHIFPTWRSLKKKARRKLLAAVNKAVREARK